MVWRLFITSLTFGIARAFSSHRGKRTGKPYRAFCSGYGLRLGEVSGGLLAVDVDGSSAEALLNALAVEKSFSGIRAIPSGEQENKELSSLLATVSDRLSVEQIYHWSGHNFQDYGETWRGCCPRHQSQSGTAFTLNPQTKEWYCFGCEVGGGAVQYRHFLQGGNGKPRGKVFRSLVCRLGEEKCNPTSVIGVGWVERNETQHQQFCQAKISKANSIGCV